MAEGERDLSHEKLGEFRRKKSFLTEEKEGNAALSVGGGFVGPSPIGNTELEGKQRDSGVLREERKAKEKKCSTAVSKAKYRRGMATRTFFQGRAFPPSLGQEGEVGKNLLENKKNGRGEGVAVHSGRGKKFLPQTFG